MRDKGLLHFPSGKPNLFPTVANRPVYLTFICNLTQLGEALYWTDR